MFRVIRVRVVIVGLLIVLFGAFLCIGFVSVVKMGHVPKNKYLIVIDAGHGGRDEGCEGVTGVTESAINLSIARKLEGWLETIGVDVVMTRQDSNGLYKSDATNFKDSDMSERLKIIDGASPDMVISIHCNSYIDSGVKGAQVYYHEGDTKGEEFAQAVQMQLLRQLDGARGVPSFGDYYLLKECTYPSIIVECGYLTNAEEETLLQDSGYQDRVSYAIVCGIIRYLGVISIN